MVLRAVSAVAVSMFALGGLTASAAEYPGQAPPPRPFEGDPTLKVGRGYVVEVSASPNVTGSFTGTGSFPGHPNAYYGKCEVRTTGKTRCLKLTPTSRALKAIHSRKRGVRVSVTLRLVASDGAVTEVWKTVRLAASP